MGQDIYEFNAQFKGNSIVTAKNMILIVGDDGTSENALRDKGDYLVQNVAINYQQPIQLIRELSTGNIYYHALPPQGTVNFGRIVGRKPITAILGAPGQRIWVAPNNINENADTASRVVILKATNGAPGPEYIMSGCIVETFGASTDANGSFVQENAAMRFGKLEVKRTGQSNRPTSSPPTTIP